MRAGRHLHNTARSSASQGQTSLFLCVFTCLCTFGTLGPVATNLLWLKKSLLPELYLWITDDGALRYHSCLHFTWLGIFVFISAPLMPTGNKSLDSESVCVCQKTVHKNSLTEFQVTRMTTWQPFACAGVQRGQWQYCGGSRRREGKKVFMVVLLVKILFFFLFSKGLDACFVINSGLCVSASSFSTSQTWASLCSHVHSHLCYQPSQLFFFFKSIPRGSWLHGFKNYGYQLFLFVTNRAELWFIYLKEKKGKIIKKFWFLKLTVLWPVRSTDQSQSSVALIWLFPCSQVWPMWGLSDLDVCSLTSKI